MIIKSLSRKGGVGAFRQLYDYISRDCERERLWHNINAIQPQRSQVIDLFTSNARSLKLSPRYNVCYHEIISFKRNTNMRLQDQKEALRTISQIYLEKRAGKQMAYGAIHTDKENTIHMHLMISSNGAGEKKRVLLPKKEFLQIQKEMERLVHERYPQLDQEHIYQKEKNQERENAPKRERRDSDRSKDRNPADSYHKRTPQERKKTQREDLRQILEHIFHNSPDKEAVRVACLVYGITLEKRGNNMVATLGTLKCRLRTLGIQDLYARVGREKGYLGNTKDSSKSFYNPEEERDKTPLTPEQREERRQERKAELDEIYRQKKERGDRGYERTRERER